MEKLSDGLERHIDLLISRYPVLDTCRQDITAAYLILEKCYENDHKLLIAGNGGSAADSEHIAGELMKRFKIARQVPADLASKLKEIDPVCWLRAGHCCWSRAGRLFSYHSIFR